MSYERNILTRIPQLFVDEAAKLRQDLPGLSVVLYKAKDSNTSAGVVAGKYYTVEEDGTHVLFTNAGSSGSVVTDTISESTVGAGVTVDGVLIKDGTITTTSPIINSVDPAIIATGTDDTDGYALTKQINIITGGNANTGVELPTAVVGQVITVINLTTTDKKVYANTSDAIDDKTATTGFVTLKAEDVVTFYCYTTALWQSDFESEASYSNLYAESVTNAAGTMIAAFYPQVVQNDIAAGTGGAIAVTNYLTTINTDAGGDAFTLANGTQIGQLKKILLVADGGGDAVITVTSLTGGTTATFDDANDYLILQWSGTAWVVLENIGVTIA